jgi:hypothetical protein
MTRHGSRHVGRRCVKRLFVKFEYEALRGYKNTPKMLRTMWKATVGVIKCNCEVGLMSHLEVKLWRSWAIMPLRIFGLSCRFAYLSYNAALHKWEFVCTIDQTFFMQDLIPW